MKGAKMVANLTLNSGGTEVTIIQKIMGHNDIIQLCVICILATKIN